MHGLNHNALSCSESKTHNANAVRLGGELRMKATVPPGPWLRRHSCRPPSTGFVLIATLVAITIISLGAAYFASQVDKLRINAGQMQTWAEAEREAFLLRETLLFAAATGIREEGGLAFGGAVLATDGRQYTISKGLVLNVQDERGLLAINTLDERTIARFFTSIGVRAEEHARLADALLDYIDPDNLRRLNGAEAQDYARVNRPPPSNDFLRSREQLRDVLGWSDILDRLVAADQSSQPGVQTRFIDLFSTARHFGLNLNSAPAAVLASVPGMDPARIAALLDQRRAQAFTSLAQLVPFTNGPIDTDYLGLVGANDLRVVLRKLDLPFLLECQLTITPAARDRPTRLKECFRRPAAALKSNGSDEFQRALAKQPNSRVSTEVTTQKPSTTASRNDQRDAIQAVEPAAPKWLVEAVTPR
ncbi:MAG: general secretion pathway protein GspK [Rhodocyclaceae bacterium]|nr:general secretion pathway protein GspK [Rhodocyclaceae bacterium]